MGGLNSSRCLLVLLAGLCLHASWVLGDWEHWCTLETKREGPRGLCGHRLPEVLHLVCRMYGGFRDKYDRKRSDTEKTNHIKDIILGKREALSYLSKRSSGFGEQGITCECCYNMCNYRELVQYCKSSRRTIPGRRRPRVGK